MCSCGGLQFVGGRLGLPEAILAEQGVEQADKLAHDGDEGDLGRLAAGEESFVEGLGRGFATDRGQGRHVEQVARLGAAAADGATAAVLAGVAVEGSEAEQGSGLAAAEGAELGHVGAEAGGGDGAAAGDRADDGGAAGECGVGGDAGEHAALAVGDVGLQGVEGGAGAAGGLRGEFGAELAEGAELFDELAAESEPVAEQLEVARQGRGRLEAVEEAEAGEHGGVDAVVLGELADGLGEAPGAQGIDQDGLDAGVEEALVEVAVVAAGGLEDGAGDAALEQPVAQGAAAGLGVLDWRSRLESRMWASSFDLPTSMPATTMGLSSVIPVFLSFCDSGRNPRFRSGRAGMGATGRPSCAADLSSEVRTVRPVAARGPGQAPGRPPPTGEGRDLLPAAAVAYTTCGTGERGSGVVATIPFSPAPLHHKRVRTTSPRCAACCRPRGSRAATASRPCCKGRTPCSRTWNSSRRPASRSSALPVPPSSRPSHIPFIPLIGAHAPGSR